MASRFLSAGCLDCQTRPVAVPNGSICTGCGRALCQTCGGCLTPRGRQGAAACPACEPSKYQRRASEKRRYKASSALPCRITECNQPVVNPSSGLCMLHFAEREMRRRERQSAERSVRADPPTRESIRALEEQRDRSAAEMDRLLDRIFWR